MNSDLQLGKEEVSLHTLLAAPTEVLPLQFPVLVVMVTVVMMVLVLVLVARFGAVLGRVATVD